MTIVVDIGNTQAKWARVRGDGLADHGGAPLAAPDPLAPLRASLEQAPDRIVAANVAGDALKNALAAIAQTCGVALELIEPAQQRYGVRCAYADPSKLGADRWVGVVAAHLLIGGPACVIDAGTTVTLDAVAADGGHLGGLIMAGPAVTAAALGRETRGIGPTATAASPAAGLMVLGRSTNDAVAHGTMLGLAAGLDRAVAEVSAAIGKPLTVVLTGGGAATLEPWLETAVSYRPHFILEGLARIDVER